MSTKMECYDCSGWGYTIEVLSWGRERKMKCDTCDGTGFNLPDRKSTEETNNE